MENALVTPDDAYNYEVIEGGKVEYKENNKIYLSEQSSAYGPCSHELTKEILHKYFSGKENIYMKLKK